MFNDKAANENYGLIFFFSSVLFTTIEAILFLYYKFLTIWSLEKTLTVFISEKG